MYVAFYRVVFAALNTRARVHTCDVCQIQAVYFLFSFFY